MDDEEVPVERDIDIKLEEKNDRQTIDRQLKVFWRKKYIRAKTILQIIKNLERVTINRDNEVIYVDKVPTGLKIAVL